MKLRRLTALLLVFLMAASACSETATAGSDEANATASDPTAAEETVAEEPTPEEEVDARKAIPDELPERI